MTPREAAQAVLLGAAVGYANAQVTLARLGELAEEYAHASASEGGADKRHADRLAMNDAMLRAEAKIAAKAFAPEANPCGHGRECAPGACGHPSAAEADKEGT